MLTSLALLVLLIAPACANHTGHAANNPELVAPAALDDLDDYTAARNAYALLEVGSPEREQLRTRLSGFLVDYAERALADARPGAAVDALEHAAGLWTPAELRSPAPNPELARAGLDVYAAVARSGDERPALLALGIAHAFGDTSVQAEAEAGVAEVRDWVDRTADFAEDPRLIDALDRMLEDVTSVLPSPYLVEQLAAVYLDRFREAQQQGPLSESRRPPDLVHALPARAPVHARRRPRRRGRGHRPARE